MIFIVVGQDHFGQLRELIINYSNKHQEATQIQNRIYLGVQKFRNVKMEDFGQILGKGKIFREIKGGFSPQFIQFKNGFLYLKN